MAAVHKESSLAPGRKAAHGDAHLGGPHDAVGVRISDGGGVGGRFSGAGVGARLSGAGVEVAGGRGSADRRSRETRFAKGTFLSNMSGHSGRRSIIPHGLSRNISRNPSIRKSHISFQSFTTVPRTFFAKKRSGLELETQQEVDETTFGDKFKEFLLDVKQNFISVFALAAFVWLYCQLLLFTNIMSVSIIIYLTVSALGLAIFATGLRYGLMPLGTLAGEGLPRKASSVVVYLCVFSLGVLCTIAEPAIAALQEVGQTMDEEKAPLLANVLGQTLLLVIFVGSGVGLAAFLGCLRLILGWSIKPVLYCACIPALLLTMAMMIIGGDLTQVVGLAWDCGAVTTGPVTVPIVIALGIGLSKAAAKGGGGNISAASSVNPVMGAVSIEVSASRGPVRASRPLLNLPAEGDRDRGSGADRSSGAASMHSHGMDSHGADSHFANSQPAGPGGVNDLFDEEDEEDEDDLAGFGIVTFASLFPIMAVWALALVLNFSGVDARRLREEMGVRPSMHSMSYMHAQEDLGSQVIASLKGTLQAIVPLAGFLLLILYGVVREPVKGICGIMVGLMICMFGMFMFTLGLGGALVPMGARVGEALPQAIVHWGDIGGAIVICLFGFLCGVLATFSEPALMALGETVEALTNGDFKKFALVGAVAFGVGIGIAVGFVQVFYKVDLWIILLVGYGICLILTVISDDMIVSIAWDSAGVTTGPVTVPIVLAAGLALGVEAGVVEGFGILTCASIGPIASVLTTGLISNCKKAEIAAPVEEDVQLS